MNSPIQQPPRELPLSIHFDESKTSDHSCCFNTSPSVALPVDEVPDGGYDWVVVSASSLITYGLFPILLATVPATMLLRERHTYAAVKIDCHYSRIDSGIATFPFFVPLSSYRCMRRHSPSPEAWVQYFLLCSISLPLSAVLDWVISVTSLAL